MSLPSQVSDAGPLCRTPHPLDPTEYVYCASCVTRADRRGASRCQGAAPEAPGEPADMCCSYLCELCEVRCWGCNLPVCEEHRVTIHGHVQCHQCSADITSAHALAIAEALEVSPERITAAVMVAIRKAVAA